MTRLFIGNVPFRTSVSDLLQVLRRHGPVERAWLAVDTSTGRLRGFAYAEVGTSRDADLLVSTFNGKLIDGFALTVAPVTGP